MRKTKFVLNTVAAFALCLLTVSLAQAQSTRTWVSQVSGDDINACSRTAPCMTFTGASAKTSAGGEINVIDAGGYGSISITKSLTIDGYGTEASILSGAGSGVTVAAGATDRVILRNLVINGTGGMAAPNIQGLDGIRYISGDKLIVENVRISRFNNSLINVQKSANGNLVVNGLQGTTSLGAAANDAGIRITTTAGTVRATITNTTLNDCRLGIHIQDNVRATIRDTTIQGNGGGAEVGVRIATVAAAATTSANLEGVTISNVNEGIRTTTVGGEVTASLSNCNIYNTFVGSNAGAGVSVTSFINNRFADNATDTSGPFTTKNEQ